MSYQFEGQLRDEEVILVCKQHPIALLKPWLICDLIILLPFATYNLIGLSPLLTYLIPICLLAAFTKGYASWNSWNNSVLLLTNRRVLFVMQKSVTNRQILGSGLEHVHRVTNEVKGLLPTLFNYGSIAVSTDDPATALVMPAIADPFGVQQEILRMVFGEADTA